MQCEYNKLIFFQPQPSAPNISKELFSSTDVLKSEIVWVLKSMTSHYSFKSSDNIKSIFRFMFPDSSVAEQFTVTERKCAHVACHGIYPYFKAHYNSKIEGEPLMNHSTK